MLLKQELGDACLIGKLRKHVSMFPQLGTSTAADSALSIVIFLIIGEDASCDSTTRLDLKVYARETCEVYDG